MKAAKGENKGGEKTRSFRSRAGTAMGGMVRSVANSAAMGMGGGGESNETGTKTRRASMMSRAFGHLLAADPNLSFWGVSLLSLESGIDVEYLRHAARERLCEEIFRLRAFYDMDRKQPQFVELDLDEIDMEYHVQEKDMEGASADKVYEFIGDLYRHPVDQSKPLWQVLVFSNLEDEVAMVAMIMSHAIGDAASQLEILVKLMDPFADEEQDEDVGNDTNFQYTAMQEEMKGKRKNSMARRASMFGSGLVQAFGTVFAPPKAPETLRQDANSAPGHKKAIGFTAPLKLQQVQKVTNKMPGTTLNDIMVSLLSMVIRRYLEHVEDKILEKKGAMLNSTFAIDLRKEGDSALKDGEPSNNFAVGNLRIPLHFDSRIDLVWKVKNMVERLRLGPLPFMQRAMGMAADISKKQAKAYSQRILSRDSIVLSTTSKVHSNATLDGKNVDDVKYLVISPAALHLGITMYDGNLFGCIVSDTATSVNPEELSRFWEPEFKALYDEVTVHRGLLLPPN